MSNFNYTHVLYHGGCPDGFGAAFAAWKKLGWGVQYIALQPSDPFPALPADSRVVMLDMSFKRDQFVAFRKSVESVVVLDHHLTGRQEIGDLTNTYFDMEHSGAFLAWKHFHPDTLVPDLILHIEDRDLWKFKLPHSREVGAALNSYEQRFDLWEQLSTMGMDKLALDGGVILRYQAQVLDRICGNAIVKPFEGHEVPVVNTCVMTSEVGDRLCQIHPTAPFAVSWFDRPGMRCYSLRSPGRFDVSTIARKNGGGGHASAAGYVVRGDA